MAHHILPDLPPVPHDPSDKFSFPKRSLGKNKVVSRSCQASWFKNWPFLHYNEHEDMAYCHTCVTAFREKMRGTQSDSAFVSLPLLLS